jgi:hypothetical protein
MEKFVCSGCTTGWCKTDVVECVAEVDDTEDRNLLDLIKEYEAYLADKSDLDNFDHFEKGVDILVRAEKLGYYIRYFRGYVGEEFFIPGFVYAERKQHND